MPHPRSPRIFPPRDVVDPHRCSQGLPPLHRWSIHNSLRSVLRWLCAGLAAGLPLAASAADLAWTDTRVSPALRVLQADVMVSYRPTARDPRPGPGARVTHVHAARHYEGDARILTRLCWRSAEGPCLPMQGSQMDTHGFDGLAPEGPFLLVHRVLGWPGTAAPVFVRGSVTVWFSNQLAR